MPSGVYERKPRKSVAEKRKPRKDSTLAKLLAKMRAERDAAVDKVTALGTAIDALEAIE